MTTVNVLELSLFLKMDINRYNLKILSVMIFTVQKVFFFFSLLSKDNKTSFVHFVFYYFSFRGLNHPKVTNFT